jgi:hypothetical protein
VEGGQNHCPPKYSGNFIRARTWHNLLSIQGRSASRLAVGVEELSELWDDGKLVSAVGDCLRYCCSLYIPLSEDSGDLI